MPKPFADAVWAGGDREQLLRALGACDGWELEPVDVRGADLAEKLRAAGPALVPVADGWVGLRSVRGGRAELIAPDLSTHRVDLAELEAALCEPYEQEHRAALVELLEGCGVRGNAQERAVRAMARERIEHKRVATIWQLRVSPGSSFAAQAKQAGLVRRLAIFAGAHAMEYTLWLAAWIVVGKGALEGRFDSGWLAAWSLLLLTMVPFRLLTTWSQGLLATGFGGLLRQRLLVGALKLDPEEMRREGVGRLLGRTIEAEAVESLALSGGLGSALALFEIGCAVFVIGQGAGGAVQALVFVLWLALAALAAWRVYVRRERWTDARLRLTHDLVERMHGHRTRLAQQRPRDWHVEEDAALDEYVRASAAMDTAMARLTGLVPRGWLVAGIASLAPAFLAPQAGPLAVAIGGLVLGYQALRRLTAGMAQLAGAAISWRQVAPLFHAAARPSLAGRGEPAAAGDTIVDAREIVYRYPGRTQPVLEGASLQIEKGDWLLLEGESGGGKSTLASLLTGLREPSAGLLLAGGLDRATLGDRAWRKRVASAPQYHENHVLTGTFAFNLLMGRAWPPTIEDMQQAEAVCRELGLGPLIERMPGGMLQMIGETGWQLSQGERSRLFMARALLQNAEMVVLDESFAALDPENLRQGLECVLRRAQTLLVVAHP